MLLPPLKGEVAERSEGGGVDSSKKIFFNNPLASKLGLA